LICLFASVLRIFGDYFADLFQDLNEDDDHRYMMFSATFNKEFRKLAKDYLADDHVRLRVGRAGSSHRNVVQEVCIPPEVFTMLKHFDQF
jgi:superfamily II DNA/RNA helicase